MIGRQRFFRAVLHPIFLLLRKNMRNHFMKFRKEMPESRGKSKIVAIFDTENFVPNRIKFSV